MMGYIVDGESHNNEVITLTEPATIRLRGGYQNRDYTGCSARYWIVEASHAVPFFPRESGGVTDVQIDGVSIVDGEGVANVPVASSSTPGVAKVSASYGLDVANGILKINAATIDQCKKQTGSTGYQPLSVYSQHAAAFYGLAKAAGDSTQSASSNDVGTYTDEAKSKIHEMLSGSVSVTGSTPAITALPGIRYICGEVSTLDITLPASGCVDVVFESGSTPTVLTVTPPSGQTVRWANGFDPNALEADTTYEIRVRDGHLASALAWA